MENNQTTNRPFDEVLNGYIKEAQEYSDKYYEREAPTLFSLGRIPKFEIEKGKRWVKVVKVEYGGSSKSVFCFIDPTTGSMYKAASWNKPATGIRGNIYNEKRPIHLGQFYR